MAISADSRPSIVEPVQVASTSLAGLANHQAASHSHQLQAFAGSSSTCHGILAVGAAYRISSKGTPKRSRDLAAYASRTAGVVVFNVHSQTPIFSSTFSSSLQPSSPPLVLYDATRRITFVVLRDRSGEGDAELHTWSEELTTSSSSSDQVSHRSFKVPSTIISLHATSGKELVALHSDGTVTLYAFGDLAKAEISRVSSLPGSDVKSTDLFVSLFDRAASTELLRGSEAKPTQALLIRISTSTTSHAPPSASRRGRKSTTDIADEFSTKISFIAIDDTTARNAEHRVRLLGQKTVGEISIDDRSRVHVHPSGRLSVLSKDSLLTTGILHSSLDNAPIVDQVNSMQLHGLQETSSVLSISRSTVQVAGLSSLPSDNSTRVCIALFDVELNSALAEFSWKVAEDTGQVFLHRLGGEAALLLTSPTSVEHGKAIARLWHVAFNTGDGSHLRWSLTMRHLTQKWLSSESEVTNSSFALVAHEGRFRTVLHRLRQVDSSSKASDVKREALEKVFDDFLNHYESESREDASLPQDFVRAILPHVLPIATSAQDSYSKNIVRTLLERRAIHATDIEGSALLQTLVRANDWDAVGLALQTVDDLDEGDIIEALRSTLGLQRSKKRTEATPKPAEILRLVAAINLNSAALRRAMKDKLDVMDVESILLILLDWIQPQAKQPLLRAANAQSEASVADVDGDASKPSLQQSLAFTIDVMDTFFPLMLSSPSMGESLRRMSASLKAHLSTAQSLGMLRGPLAAFAKIEEDREREAEALLIDSLAILDSDAEDDANDDDDDDDDDRHVRRLWAAGGRDALGGKAGRPRSGASATMQIGGGAHARSGQKEKTRRQQAYADRMAVGLYTLERFEP